MLNPDTSPRLLVVEGQDDEHVIRHLRQRNLPMPDFRIASRSSVSELLRAIEGDVQAPGRTALGILVDADGDVKGRWQAVADRLRRVKIEAPQAPDPSGTVIEGRPRIGVWLMPNNESPGEIEDFVAGLIPESDPVWPRSQEYVDGIPVTDRKFSSGKILRAKVHSWLATRDEPRMMGAAIHARDLSPDAPDAVRLVGWLRRLFN